jgi:hypothetical protein
VANKIENSELVSQNIPTQNIYVSRVVFSGLLLFIHA